jgi:hypothetical protein
MVDFISPVSDCSGAKRCEAMEPRLDGGTTESATAC